MKDTCNYEECKFGKLLFDKPEECVKNDMVLGYLAGFFDGEGCCSVTNNKRVGYRTHYPRVTVANTIPTVLYVYKHFWGGKVYKRSSVNGNKPVYTWNLGQLKTTKKFLVDIFPYLVLKRKQASLLLNLCETRIGQKRGKYGRFIKTTKQEIIDYRAEIRIQIMNLNGGKKCKIPVIPQNVNSLNS